MKICTKCKVEKDESEFRRRMNKSHTSTYLISYCRKCEYLTYAHISKKWQKDNAKRKNEINTSWMLRNHDAVKNKARIRAREDYKKNPINSKEASKKWRKNHPEKAKLLNARPVKQLPDSYVKKILRLAGWKNEDIEKAPDIVPIYKDIIKIKRYAKKTAG